MFKAKLCKIITFIAAWKFVNPLECSIFLNKYTDQNYKRKTFVFAPIFPELNSKI